MSHGRGGRRAAGVLKLIKKKQHLQICVLLEEVPGVLRAVPTQAK